MKALLIVAGAAFSLASFADPEKGNVLPNGDFEDVEAIAKASSHHVMGLLRGGWEFSRGPIAFFPRGWFPTANEGVLEAVECSEDARLRPYVHSGVASVRIGSHKGAAGAYNRVWSPKPGKYRISVWARGSGTGRVTIAHYDRNRPLGRQDCGLRIVPSPDVWTKFASEVEIGAGYPEANKHDLIVIFNKGVAWIDDFSFVPLAEGRVLRK